MIWAIFKIFIPDHIFKHKSMKCDMEVFLCVFHMVVNTDIPHICIHAYHS